MFQKIFDEIKYLCKVATAGSKEARQLEKVKKTFEEAYRQKNNTATDDGVKYSMAGVKSKTSDKSLLLKAEQLVASGVDSETVRQETGWYKGYDGKWRYEIDDSKCELIENPNLEKHEDVFVGTYFTGKVSDILNHNDLFEAYPQLQDIEVVIQPTDVGLRGRYEGGSDKYITLNLELFKRHTTEYDDILKNSATEIKNIEQTPEYKEYNKWHEDEEFTNIDPEEWLVQEEKAREKFFSSELGKRYYYLKWGKKNIQTHEFGWSKSAKKVLMHELQHAIQEIEGFTGGSTFEYWQRKLDSGFTIKSAEQKDDLKNAEKEYNAIMKKDPYFFSVMNELVNSKPNTPRGKIDLNTFEKIEEDPIEWQRFDENRDKLEKEYGSAAVMNFFRISDKVKNLREKSYTAEEAYFKTAGEVEARDTARRLNLNAEQRKNTRPDIDRTDVVFSDSEKGFDLIGYTEDGRKVYTTGFDQTVPMDKKISEFKKRISTIFNLGAVELKTDVKKIKILADKFTATKNLYGDKYQKPEEHQALVNSLYDLADILASSKYLPTKTQMEPSYKNPLIEPKNKAHKGVKYWYKFQNEIVFDGVNYTVTFNIRDKGKEQYQYNIEFKENKTPGLNSTVANSILQSTDQVSYDNSVPQDNATVNNNSMQDKSNYSLSNANDDIAPVGNNNVYGEDIKLQPASAEDIAPIGENVAPGTDTNESNVPENLVPLTEDDIKKQNTLVIDDAPIKETRSATHNDLVNQMSDIMDETAESDIKSNNVSQEFIEQSNKSFGIEKINDYVHVQKQVFNTLKNEGFFTSEDKNSRIDYNEDSGMVIETNKKGIKETFDGKNYSNLGKEKKTLKLATIRKLPEIIKNGKLVDNDVDNYHNENSGVKFAYIQSVVEVDGKEVQVQIDIKKSPQKNKFWVHSVQISENPMNIPSVASGAIKRVQNSSDYEDSVPNPTADVKEDLPDYFVDSENKQKTKTKRKTLHECTEQSPVHSLFTFCQHKRTVPLCLQKNRPLVFKCWI